MKQKKADHRLSLLVVMCERSVYKFGLIGIRCWNSHLRKRYFMEHFFLVMSRACRCVWHFSFRSTSRLVRHWILLWIVWFCVFFNLHLTHVNTRRSQWSRGLRRRSAAARLLRLWVRIPPRAWMDVCRECCVLPGRAVCVGLINRPGESYRL